jgi:hypothetical protein
VADSGIAVLNSQVVSRDLFKLHNVTMHKTFV